MAETVVRLRKPEDIFKNLRWGVRMAAGTIAGASKIYIGSYGPRTGRLYDIPGTSSKRRAGSIKRTFTNSEGDTYTGRVKQRSRLIGRGKDKGRYRKQYRASAPGEPPAVRTGSMRKNIRASAGAKEQNRYIASIGVKMDGFNYARYLEHNPKGNPRSFIRAVWRQPEIRRKALLQIATSLKSKSGVTQ